MDLESSLVLVWSQKTSEKTKNRQRYLKQEDRYDNTLQCVAAVQELSVKMCSTDRYVSLFLGRENNSVINVT